MLRPLDQVYLPNMAMPWTKPLHHMPVHQTLVFVDPNTASKGCLQGPNVALPVPMSLYLVFAAPDLSLSSISTLVLMCDAPAPRWRNLWLGLL